MTKKDRLKKLIQDLHAGRSEAEVKAQFKQEFGHVTSEEISQMEQALIREGTSVQDIQKLCNVHAAIFSGNITDLHTMDRIDRKPGHPLFVFRKENQGIYQYMEETVRGLMDRFQADPTDDHRIDLLAAIKKLATIDQHYARKENLFFPYLEKNGITGPPQVMWGKDDEIRDRLKHILQTELAPAELLEAIEDVLEEIDSMIIKENDILSPLLVRNIEPADWVTIAQASHQIGYVFSGGIEGASPSDANHWLEKHSGQLPEEPAEEVLEATGFIRFPSGLIRHEDLIHMLNTSPQDFTYIDQDDKVRYFSEGKHPVFDRTRTIIGRDVRLCHPPRAVPVVDQMLADFKAGLKDEETRIVMAGTKVLLVRYFAVRDENNHYIGTLETTEEISGIVDQVNELRRQ
ncbi:MAG TPA: DUF438 domain-containing protein [Tissierellia bacterium]|nr:DUF438 domain-containing protein [Tissierellia bacterium]